jgi:peptidoglycan/LPS O-acetylase OafA/YrhL
LVAACCVVVIIMLDVANHGNLNLFSGFAALARTLSEFSLGTLLYRLHSRSARFPIELVGSLSVLFAVLAFVTHRDFFVVGAFACLTLFGAGATNAATRMLDSKPFVALGNWSYAIYLWHAPAHYAVMGVLAATGHPASALGLFNARVLLVGTSAGVVCLSALQYKYFEAPMRRVLRQSHQMYWVAATKIPPSGREEHGLDPPDVSSAAGAVEP